VATSAGHQNAEVGHDVSGVVHDMFGPGDPGLSEPALPVVELMHLVGGHAPMLADEAHTCSARPARGPAVRLGVRTGHRPVSPPLEEIE
jgi:hypothetical protein